jgi:exosortase
MRARSLERAGWRWWHAALAITLAGAGAYVTRDAWADILAIARADEESSHIFLAPLVAAWMVWVRSIRLRLCPPGSSMIGPAMVGAGWLLHWYGFNHATQAAWHAGAVLVIVGAALSVLGRSVLFRFFPAILALGFLVPVPGAIRQVVAVPLQTATASVSQAVFEIAGMPIERSGNLLTINGVDVAVAEACNGMRMVFALVLVSYAFAFSLPLRQSVRVVVLAASPLAAILCNVLRLIPTIWLYGNASGEVADRFHDVAGWLMLPVAFGLLLGIVRLLRWALIPVGRFNLAIQ